MLSRVQYALDQESPAGFSVGGAAAPEITKAGSSIDAVVRSARDRGVTGALAIQLSPWRDAPLFVTNRTSSLSEDRTVTANAATGVVSGEFRNEDLPIIPRLVAGGIHVHQGDFGPVNLWLNRLLAVSLIWLSVTGTFSWWIRRPRGRLGAPPASPRPWPIGIVVTLALAGVLLPIFGLSVVVITAIGRLMRRPHVCS